MLGVNLVIHIVAALATMLAVGYFLQLKKEQRFLRALLSGSRYSSKRVMAPRDLINTLVAAVGCDREGDFSRSLPPFLKVDLGALGQFHFQHGIKRVIIKDNGLSFLVADDGTDLPFWSEKLSVGLSLPTQVIIKF